MLSNNLMLLAPEYVAAAGASGPVLTSTGDKVVFTVPFKCQLVHVGAVVTATCAGATTTPVVDFDLRPTAGSDTGRGSANLGHLVLSTTAGGKMMFDRAGAGTELNVGDEIVCECSTAATGTGAAGNIRPFVLVEYWPEELENMTDAVETA